MLLVSVLRRLRGYMSRQKGTTSSVAFCGDGTEKQMTSVHNCYHKPSGHFTVNINTNTHLLNFPFRGK